MSLDAYRRKRNFKRTQEPAGEIAPHGKSRYLIQKHDASRLHYDFRLELNGVLKSWAVPKGPSLDPNVKALAVHVEDHPIEYGSFEGVIPQGEYGGGTVMLWDRGTWDSEGDAAKNYEKGKLVFQLHGERLKGRWALIRMGGKAGQDGKNWLLKKLDDNEASNGKDQDILRDDTSIASGQTMEQIAGNSRTSRKTAKPKPRGSRTSRPATAEQPDGRVRDLGEARLRDITSLAGARASAMPATIEPELPTLVRQVPGNAQGHWLYELKLDGYRMICFVRAGKATLRTRHGNDWTNRFPTIAAAIEALGFENAILDGEVVALGPDGRSDFQALQNMLHRGDDTALVYFLFDLPYYHGHDLRQVTLIERKKCLSRLIGRGAHSRVIRYSDHIAGQGAQVFERACGHGLEGLVAKRSDSHYVERRTTDWLKLKCMKRQEFVIGGWTEPGGARTSLGSLLVGYYRDPSELVYCGRVGTGFSGQSLRDLQQALGSLKQDRPPFSRRVSGVAARGVIHWVKPRLVAEVAFAAWTADGILRHASFQGLREDKHPSEIRRELPVDEPASVNDQDVIESRSPIKTAAVVSSGGRKSGQDPADEFAGVRITHPDRILFDDAKVTKRDLARYYMAVAPVLLPHVVGRPLSLVRCPNGAMKDCFYQKHLGESMPEAVRGVSIQEKSGMETCIVIDDVAGLISLVQLGVVEIHPWGSRADQVERPDRLIFDLDPAEDLSWSDVERAARHVKERLDGLKLQSFARTTGGKGLHIVVPIARRTSWKDLKAFARAVADALVRDHPSHFIAQSNKAKRAGKIYLDYLRNERGATAVAPYSTRARKGATVATPITWDELSPTLRPDRFTTRTVPARLETLTHDPWAGFFDVRQSITQRMKAIV